MQTRNQYLGHLIDSSFQGVNRLYVLSFKNNAYQRSYRQYFLPTVTMKYYNDMVERKNVFYQVVKNDRRKYDNIRKNMTDQGDLCLQGVYRIMFIFKVIIR